MTNFLDRFFDSFGGNYVFKYIKKGNLPKRLRTTEVDETEWCRLLEGILEIAYRKTDRKVKTMFCPVCVAPAWIIPAVIM